jgi:hypothetical protein
MMTETRIVCTRLVRVQPDCRSGQIWSKSSVGILEAPPMDLVHHSS